MAASLLPPLIRPSVRRICHLCGDLDARHPFILPKYCVICFDFRHRCSFCFKDSYHHKCSVFEHLSNTRNMCACGENKRIYPLCLPTQCQNCFATRCFLRLDPWSQAGSCEYCGDPIDKGNLETNVCCRRCTRCKMYFILLKHIPNLMVPLILGFVSDRPKPRARCESKVFKIIPG